MIEAAKLFFIFLRGEVGFLLKEDCLLDSLNRDDLPSFYICTDSLVRIATAMRPAKFGI